MVAPSGRNIIKYFSLRQRFALLSNHVWGLKNTQIPHKISWKILSRGQSLNPTNKQYNLCLKEKYFIIFRPNVF